MLSNGRKEDRHGRRGGQAIILHTDFFFLSYFPRGGRKRKKKVKAILSILFIYIFYVYRYFSCIYICVPHNVLMPTQGRPRVFGPLELELGMLVSCMWVLGLELRSSGREASALNC